MRIRNKKSQEYFTIENCWQSAYAGSHLPYSITHIKLLLLITIYPTHCEEQFLTEHHLNLIQPLKKLVLRDILISSISAAVSMKWTQNWSLATSRGRRIPYFVCHCDWHYIKVVWNEKKNKKTQSFSQSCICLVLILGGYSQPQLHHCKALIIPYSAER